MLPYTMVTTRRLTPTFPPLSLPSDDDRKDLESTLLPEYLKAWFSVDPDGLGEIDRPGVRRLLRTLPKPLGLGKYGTEGQLASYIFYMEGDGFQDGDAEPPPTAGTIPEEEEPSGPFNTNGPFEFNDVLIALVAIWLHSKGNLSNEFFWGRVADPAGYDFVVSSHLLKRAVRKVGVWRLFGPSPFFVVCLFAPRSPRPCAVAVTVAFVPLRSPPPHAPATSSATAATWNSSW
jgi:hypothetical protein